MKIKIILKGFRRNSWLWRTWNTGYKIIYFRKNNTTYSKKRFRTWLWNTRKNIPYYSNIGEQIPKWYILCLIQKSPIHNLE